MNNLKIEKFDFSDAVDEILSYEENVSGYERFDIDEEVYEAVTSKLWDKGYYTVGMEKEDIKRSDDVSEYVVKKVIDGKKMEDFYRNTVAEEVDGVIYGYDHYYVIECYHDQVEKIKRNIKRDYEETKEINEKFGIKFDLEYNL